MVGRALLDGDYEAAADAADEGLRAAEETGEPIALAFAFGNAGLAALFLERMDVAERLFHQQIEIFRRERIDGLWDEPATGLACVAAHAGDDERAATFLGFGEAMPAMPVAPNEDRRARPARGQVRRPARAALGERAWTARRRRRGRDDARRAVRVRARSTGAGRHEVEVLAGAAGVAPASVAVG